MFEPTLLLASVTPSWRFAKLPADVGVPLRVMVLPLREAVRPGGRPLWVRFMNGLLPMTGIMAE